MSGTARGDDPRTDAAGISNFPRQATPRQWDTLFVAGQASLLAFYVLLILGLLAALALFTSGGALWHAVQSEEIRYAFCLSVLSCTLTALLSLWVAIPAGYLLSRTRFGDMGLVEAILVLVRTESRPNDRFADKDRWNATLDIGKALVDAILDIPIVLPPLVLGLALLILFQTPPGRAIERLIPVTFAVPSVVIAQFSVACAFAVRTMRVTFDQINPRAEKVALTLGCSRAQAFWMVALPEARRGVVTAATLAWARSLGEFGPILVFSGATRFRTEVLPTTVFLELSIGNIEAAAAVSLWMVATALAVLLLARSFGLKGSGLI